MALRVWLPLNGTLENKGISNVTVTNNNVTIDNNGKIGKCYYFNGSSYCYENTYDWSNFNTSAFSLCCWYKEPSPVASGNSQIICIGTSSGWNNIRIGLLRRTSNGYPMFSVSNGSSAVQYSFTATNFSLDVWNHIAVTYNNGAMSMYINGVLDKTMNTTIVPVLNSSQHLGIGSASNGAEKLSGYLNDVRIYDHVLSAKEVKEISQGLVLHYKLDNPYVESTTNLITTEDCLSSICYNGAINKYGYGTNTDMYKTIVKFNGKKCTKLYMGTNGNSCYPYVYIDNMFTSDGTNQPEYKTLSFDYYTTVSTSIRPYKLGSGSGTATYIVKNSSIKTGTGTNSVVIPVEQNTWNHIEITFHGTTAANAEWGYIQNQPAHTSNTANYWLFANMQLESKDHATGYAGVGGSRTEVVVKDSSGYENNGNIIGILTTVQDSPRYKISTNFNGRPCAISSNSSFSHLNTFTYNCWFKRSTDEPAFLIMGYQYGNNSSGSLGIDNTGCAGFHYYAHANGNGDTQVGSSHNCNDNTWHMLTATYDGVKVISYLDGQKTNEKTVTLLTSSRTFVVNYPSGSENSGIYRDYQGQLSDVRVYATVLSAEDILDLYHTPANIDNLGGIHSFEMTEDVSSRELLALPWTSSYWTHNKTSISTNYNDKHEWYSNTNSSAGSDYIKINPIGKAYYYDAEISVAAGNQFYIGFERYDANKTPRSNAACVYIIAIKPNNDINHQRYFGTVNLADDGTNPADTITLRVLNAWSGTDSSSTKEATIHYLSLREVTGTPQTGKIKKQGQIYTDEFVEREKQASIYENGFVGGHGFIEK